MKNEFTQYDISQEIIEALEMLKYNKPTQVQEKVIPAALAGRDIIARSKTGSGKTAAFAIPLAEMAVWMDNLAGALVLEPTRELAYQVKDEIFNIGRKKRLKVPVVFGGFPLDKQALTLKQKSHIVVGTPGRTLDHIRRGTLNTDNIKYLVIDEADLMLDMGFLDDVQEIIDSLKNKVTIMLFSATLDDKILAIKEKYMNDPVEVEIEDTAYTEGTIKELAYMAENEEKFRQLMKILIVNNPETCMIFCATREMVNVLTRQLQREKVKCKMIHGLVEQEERIETVAEFREGRFRYLVATDVAARGIDFENISLVINYDFPTSKETYVHRIGRTGRNGKSGVAVSLISEADMRMYKSVLEYTGRDILIEDNISEEDVDNAKKAFYKRQRENIAPKKKKGAVFDKQITKLSIGGGRKSKMRAVDIVGSICSIDGIVADDIGIIDVRDSLTYVEIQNGKGDIVLEGLQNKTIKGKIRKVRITSGRR